MDERVRLQTAPRTSSREITYFDSYGLTFENGPAFPCTFSNGPGVAVDVDIVASRKDVWNLMSDINFASKFSNEFIGANWDQESPSIKQVIPLLGEIRTNI